MVDRRFGTENTKEGLEIPSVLDMMVALLGTVKAPKARSAGVSRAHSYPQKSKVPVV